MTDQPDLPAPVTHAVGSWSSDPRGSIGFTGATFEHADGQVVGTVTHLEGGTLDLGVIARSGRRRWRPWYRLLPMGLRRRVGGYKPVDPADLDAFAQAFTVDMADNGSHATIHWTDTPHDPPA